MDDKEVVAVGAQDIIENMLRIRDMLTKMRDDSQGWTAESVSEKFQAACQMCQELKTTSSHATDAIMCLKSVRKTQVQTSAAQRRRAMLCNSKRLSEVRGQGFPKTLMTWLAEDVFGKPSDDPERESTVSKRVPQAKDDRDLSVLRFWSSEEKGAFSTAARAHFSQFGDKCKKGAARMKPMLGGASNSTRHLLSWLGSKAGNASEKMLLPAECGERDLQIVLHAPKSFGAPILMMSTKLGFRHAPEDWRFPGMGCLIQGVSGSTVVVTWAMDRVATTGTTPSDELKFLEGLPGGSAKARAYMQDKAHWVAVVEGDIVWVPFAHHVWLIAEHAESAVIAQPCFDPKLMEQCPDDQRMTATTAMTSIVEARQDKEPFSHFAEAFRRFAAAEWVFTT